MQYQRINEVARMQKLAGIITENKKYNKTNLFEDFNLFEEESPVSDDAIEKAIAKITKTDPSKIDLDQIEKESDKNEKQVGKEQLEESLLATFVLLIPTILETLGGLINYTKRKLSLSDDEKKELAVLNKKIEDKKIEIKNFKGSEEEKEALNTELKNLSNIKKTKYSSKAGEKLKDLGHRWHGWYTYPIKAILKGAAWIERQEPGKKSGALKMSKLQNEEYRKKVANVIYATIMIFIGGYGVVEQVKNLDGVEPVVTAIVDSIKTGVSMKEVLESAVSKIA